MPDADSRPLDERLRPFLRTAWLPEVVEGDEAPDDSKFSGAPALGPGEAWPACGNCGRPMQLFVQLNARDLPPAAAGMLEGGILQLFYCTSSEPPCEVDCEAYFPRARSTLVRLLAPDEAAGGAGRPVPGMFPAKRIVGWTPVDDLPNGEELDELGVHLDEDETSTLEARELPRSGEKLLGWPNWIQGIEYPSCRVCGQRMTLLFQIDSEQHLPYMFGDMGIGHVTQCAAHRAELAFGWACS